MQRLRNELVDTLAELEEVQATHDQEKDVLQARIQTLKEDLAREKADNAKFIQKLTKLITPIPSSSFLGSFPFMFLLSV